ncbi:hypothetical protein SARC_08048 [Sphaeroforma arctica JP610]|uniref:Endonuclease/exonuclease/phosphatase domain-containing protein n=1 Tax=Sphaeroforma arctica JP610 TaxID=667725 RepID=A0A0L0FS09_9EUKA|nr:hypothetical protein SARC_08048 [Sphaeroforma arctica JP610]KNC79562.1 hypothetical protein SARC_08048 [Sphaeroforma arctica JP610]|eukprot:XP_014153464.1 hypothetical protein SARC_08048 [Sphaeroforma arctica JP610]
MPMDAANNYFDGNTNICGHNTCIDCETLGSNDQRKMLLDYIYVRGEAFPRDADRYEAKIVMNKKYNASEDYEGVHISDHYGVQVIMNP